MSERRTLRWKRIAGLGALYHVLADTTTRFIDDDCTTLAAALAYYATFSMAPLLLIVISVVGLVVGPQVVQHEIQAQTRYVMGEDAATMIGALVKNAGQHASGGVIGVLLGILALLAGATGAFVQLQDSLNRVWHVQPDPRAGGIRNFIGERIRSLGIILAVAFLILVSLGVNAGVNAFGPLFLPGGLPGGLLAAAGIVVSLAVATVLFAAMFKVLPDARIEWRNVWIGAGVTALLFTAGRFLIGYYLGHSGVTSAYGAAGSLVLVVLWIYYSALIVLFGAELTARWSEAGGGPAAPKYGAVRIHNQQTLELPPRAA